MESVLPNATVPSQAVAAQAQRVRYVDVFRGLLIAHMALDHASLMFNAGRGGEELAGAAGAGHGDLLQFLTRFTGVPVAPAFFFMAGFMVALTSLAREHRGVPQHEVTRRLIVRGLVLIAVDALIMGLPRAAMGFYSFVVLSSIGAAPHRAGAGARRTEQVLLPAALAVLALHPLLDVSALPVPLRAILYEPVRSGGVPVPVPGDSVVRDRGRRLRRRPRRSHPRATGAASGAAGVVSACSLFFAIRLTGGLRQRVPIRSVTSLDFWFFAKYPPDLPFLAWSFAATFFGSRCCGG